MSHKAVSQQGVSQHVTPKACHTRGNSCKLKAHSLSPAASKRRAAKQVLWMVWLHQRNVTKLHLDFNARVPLSHGCFSDMKVEHYAASPTIAEAAHVPGLVMHLKLTVLQQTI